MLVLVLPKHTSFGVDQLGENHKEFGTPKQEGNRWRSEEKPSTKFMGNPMNSSSPARFNTPHDSTPKMSNAFILRQGFQWALSDMMEGGIDHSIIDYFKT